MDLKLVVVAVGAVAASACAAYRPQAPSAVPFLERAQSKQDGGLAVTVAVPDAGQVAALFGVSLAKVGVQPVWLAIDNRTDRAYDFAAISLDPYYFTPREAALRARRCSGAVNARMREHFMDLAIGSYVPPHQRIDGFVFTNLERGLKPVNVELVGQRELKRFFFLAEVPGLRTHYQRLEWARLYPPDAIRYLDEPGLRAALAELPCCGTTANGRGVEDPLNFALVGELHQVLGAFARAGWHATEVLDAASAWRTFTSYFFGRRYESAPISPVWLFGRPQDVALQKPLGTARERHHLRLWLAPYRLGGHPVWIGQVSRDIGLLYTPPLTVAHQIDPDVDEARDYLLQDLMRSQGVARVGWVSGVGATSSADPRRMADGTVFFTDGLRAVIVLATEPIGFDEIQFFDWERPAPGDSPAPFAMRSVASPPDEATTGGP